MFGLLLVASLVSVCSETGLFMQAQQKRSTADRPDFQALPIACPLSMYLNVPQVVGKKAEQQWVTPTPFALSTS
jgi:hypothetical protein